MKNIQHRQIINLTNAYNSILADMSDGLDKSEVRIYRNETLEILGYWVCIACEMPVPGVRGDKCCCDACTNEANKMFEELKQ